LDCPPLSECSAPVSLMSSPCRHGPTKRTETTSHHGLLLLQHKSRVCTFTPFSGHAIWAGLATNTLKAYLRKPTLWTTLTCQDNFSGWLLTCAPLPIGSFSIGCGHSFWYWWNQLGSYSTHTTNGLSTELSLLLCLYWNRSRPSQHTTSAHNHAPIVITHPAILYYWLSQHATCTIHIYCSCPRWYLYQTVIVLQYLYWWFYSGSTAPTSPTINEQLTSSAIHGVSWPPSTTPPSNHVLVKIRKGRRSLLNTKTRARLGYQYFNHDAAITWTPSTKFTDYPLNDAIETPHLQTHMALNARNIT
jgi:hypothetical protein